MGQQLGVPIILDPSRLMCTSRLRVFGCHPERCTSNIDTRGGWGKASTSGTVATTDGPISKTLPEPEVMVAMMDLVNLDAFVSQYEASWDRGLLVVVTAEQLQYDGGFVTTFESSG
ncbi:hypothetical protein LOK49_LG05G02853 [Camellia lanceoleosa]|uniref:Uncharacterized protein n=1 Tax=Camellia lanceoleosa TaxID=1840588 RepID=A0ACC0HSM3_9ERIC|nr:hypothetical protein LOK49_LG05G02853 [Camellia lanceoleosa]